MTYQTQLYPDQVTGINMLWEAIRSGYNRPMFQAATGYGKTIVMGQICEMAMRKNKRVMITVPYITLIDQTLEKFERVGLRDVGVIQAAHERSDWTAPIQVCSVHTLNNRKILPDFDICFVDEAHIAFRFYSRLWDHAGDKPIVGFSATPWSKGLGLRYNSLIVPATISELIDTGRLCDFEVYAPTSPDLSNVSVLAGDYHEGELSEAMQQNGLVADVVATWKQKAEGKATLCFGVDRAHAKKLQEQFRAAGVRTDYVDAYTKTEIRQEIRRRFREKEIDVICNVDCFSTGFDENVECISIARPTKSEIKHVQIIGRGLRTAEGKDKCLILDHSDNHKRLGFVTDIHHDKLNDGEKKISESVPKEALPKPCPKCAFVKPPKISTCPICGFKPETRSMIACKDGELERLYNTDRAERYSFYCQLAGVAEKRGYKPGWISNAFFAKYKTWPPESFKETKRAIEPSSEVTGFVKHLQIRYFKGKQRARANV